MRSDFFNVVLIVKCCGINYWMYIVFMVVISWLEEWCRFFCVYCRVIKIKLSYGY